MYKLGGTFDTFQSQQRTHPGQLFNLRW